jgi:hypothetical protein
MGNYDQWRRARRSDEELRNRRRGQRGEWDDKTFRESVVKSAEEAGCTVKDVKVSGNQVISNAVCQGKQNMGTTTYHGDSYEQVNSSGTKVRAKRIDACP